ncbi:MAG TPA: phosphatidylglycerophosphatase A [Rhizomicrobium sp.]|nr:phosphatidylglycerophosphatase A [Rhizomicrobium sp.]
MRPSTVIASVFGIGYFPFASGTVASAVAVPLAIPILMYGGGIALAAASLMVFAAGVWACGHHVRVTGREDPSECVIDEVAGQWLACAFASVSLPALALAFILFRLFDIWKPWPVGWADRELPGGLGVMTDDMIAGLMAGVLVALASILVPL